MQKVNSTLSIPFFYLKVHNCVCTTVCLFGCAKSRSFNQATVVPLSATASAASAVRPVSLSGSHEKSYAVVAAMPTAAQRGYRRGALAAAAWWWQLRAPSATCAAAASRGTRRQRLRRGREDLLHTLLL